MTRSEAFERYEMAHIAWQGALRDISRVPRTGLCRIKRYRNWKFKKVLDNERYLFDRQNEMFNLAFPLLGDDE